MNDSYELSPTEKLRISDLTEAILENIRKTQTSKADDEKFASPLLSYFEGAVSGFKFCYTLYNKDFSQN